MSSWNDWAQDRRIREAEESIQALNAQQSRERRRLAEQLRQQSGSLQQQIDALREAFLAFVELEDVRGELAQHADAAAARRYAREVVAASVVGGRPYGVREPIDVPGYWLPAAARAITGTSEGAPTDAEHELAEARLRDPVRTAILVCLLEAVRQEPRWAPELLPQALPSGPEVTRAQRLVWAAVADGRLGEPARAQLATLLSDLGRHLDEDAVVRHLGGGGGASGALPAEVAAARLRRLTTLVQGRGESEPAASEDPLSDCLRDLIDEGAPGEAEILARMRAARVRMGGLAPTTAPTSWDDPAGDVATLLLEDLGDPAHPGRHDLAVQVLRPVLERTADQLHAEAQTAPPTRTEVVLPSGPVEVTTEGPGEGWRVAEHDRALQRDEIPAWWRPAAIGAAVLGVLGLVLVVVSPGFLLLAVAGIVAAATLGYRELTTRRTSQRYAASSVRMAEDRLGKAATELRDVHDRSVVATASADQDRETVRAALAARPAG